MSAAYAIDPMTTASQTAGSSQCPSCFFRTFAADRFKCKLCTSKNRAVKAFLRDCAELLAEPDLQRAPKIVLVLQDTCDESFLVSGDIDLLFHTKPVRATPLARFFKPGLWQTYWNRTRELRKTGEMQMPELIPGTDIYTMFTMFTTGTQNYIAAFAMSELPD